VDKVRSGPLVSVLLPVRDGQQFVANAISSVLHQSFQDFELIVLNDGSTDGTLEICQQFQDSRIRVISNSECQGIVRTLNRGIAAAAGKYIARIDSDDIAVESRFEKQVAFLESHSDYGLIGSWMATFGERQKMWKFPISNDDIQLSILFNNPFGHPSVMFRRNWDNGLPGYYDEEFALAEDFEYWVRLAAVWRCENFSEPLTLYRIHPSQATKFDTQARDQCVQRIVTRQHEALGLNPLPLFPSAQAEKDWWREFTSNEAALRKFPTATIRRRRRITQVSRVRKIMVAVLSASGFIPLAREIRRVRESLREKTLRNLAWLPPTAGKAPEES